MIPSDQNSGDFSIYSRDTAVYTKEWDAVESSGKTFSGEEIEKLTFNRLPEGWKIAREEEIKIFGSQGGRWPFQTTFQTGWFKKLRSAASFSLAFLPRFLKSVMAHCLQSVNSSAFLMGQRRQRVRVGYARQQRERPGD
jgi:hypothetical protein